MLYRPASMVYGDSQCHKGYHLFICSRWPECDAYVTSYKDQRQPQGTLANKSLRRKRYLAHQALKALGKQRKMNKWAIYIWLQTKLNLSPDKAHISMFTEEMCDKLISICQEALLTKSTQTERRKT